jgi:hypothetical protein
VNIFVGVNGIEETPDGRIKVEKTTESRYGHFLDESFPETCVELGVEPRYTWDPSRRGYTGARDDAAYVLLHEDFVKVAKRYEVLVAVGQIELQGAEPTPTAANDHVTPSMDLPPPVSTGDIAFAFDGLGWKEAEWKKPLGDGRGWLNACLIRPGQRGVVEKGWNPVLIGAALIRKSDAKPHNIRARFQTKPQLAQWREAWKDYESEHYDS